MYVHFRRWALFIQNITKTIPIFFVIFITNEINFLIMINDEWENIDKVLDDDDIAVDKRNFLDEDGVDIFIKKSGDKTVEERIKTSRTLKIKNNNWNQVDYSEKFSNDKITIDPHYYSSNTLYEDVEFEKAFQKVIENSKYKELLLGDEKTSVNYQVVNDIIIYCYARMKRDYSLSRIFVLVCEYCGIGLQTMWKRLSSYLQLQILEDLKEVSKLPNEILNNNVKLF